MKQLLASNHLRHVAAALFVAVAAGLLPGTASSGRSADLDRVVLRATQVGEGYELRVYQQGRVVRNQVTLDLCGFEYPSEALRTGRLQVAYLRPGSKFQISNEVVSYRPGGTEQAIREVDRAVDRCPPGPVESTVQGVPPLTYRIKRLTLPGLLPGHLALEVRVSGRYQGRRVAATAVITYQRLKNVLSAVYVTGGPAKARLATATRLSRASASNIRSG
jgi:hypothetical protein